MTRKNPADRVSRDENLGSASDLHSSGRDLHEHSTNFEDFAEETSPAHCEVCGTSIPPTKTRCPDHQRSSTTHEEDRWSISHIGLAVVPAANEYHAIAMGSAAFRNRENAPGDKTSFDLIYDFDEPSKTLTQNWGGELPDAVRLDTEIAIKLLEHAASNMENRPATLHQSESPTNPYVVTEFGTEFDGELTDEGVAKAIGADQDELWVVPALLYKSKSRSRSQSSSTEESPSPVVDHSIDRAEQNHHKQMMEKLEEKGELEGN